MKDKFLKNKVNTVEAKNQFNALLAQMHKTGEPVIVEKRGEPVAVIVDFETYSRMSAPQPDTGSATLIEDLRKLHRQIRLKNPDGTGDGVALLHEARRERHGL